MNPLNISENIRPVSDLKAKASELVQQVNGKSGAVILTKHGRGVAVLLSAEEYEQLQKEAGYWKVVQAIRQGERDIEAGRVISHTDIVAKWIPRVSQKT